MYMTLIMFGDAIYRPLCIHDYECHQHFADRAVVLSVLRVGGESRAWAVPSNTQA